MIDLLLGGSPCQGFSFAGKQLNFSDPRSKLFFDYVKALEILKPKYFLFENVKMKKEYEDVITKYLGVKPIEINSSLVSAQNRKRLYWTNIPGVTQPKDKGIMLKDIIHEKFKEILFDIDIKKSDINSSNNNINDDMSSIDSLEDNKKEKPKIVIPLSKYIIPFDKTLQILDKEIENGKISYIKEDNQTNKIYYIHNKPVTLCYEVGIEKAKINQYLFGCITPDRINKRQNGQRFNGGNKFYTLTAQDLHGILIDGYIRKITPIECERLQTLPDNYTEGISNTKRYNILGNCWTIDVISHILSFIPENYLHIVVSLFDGISCGQVSLKRAKKIYNQYYASEIDKYAIQITQKNYPQTIQLGDVTKIDWKSLKNFLLNIKKETY